MKNSWLGELICSSSCLFWDNLSSLWEFSLSSNCSLTFRREYFSQVNLLVEYVSCLAQLYDFVFSPDVESMKCRYIFPSLLTSWCPSFSIGVWRIGIWFGMLKFVSMDLHLCVKSCRLVACFASWSWYSQFRSIILWYKGTFLQFTPTQKTNECTCQRLS